MAGSFKVPVYLPYLQPKLTLRALVVRAAGPSAAERIAESVLEVAEWFP